MSPITAPRLVTEMDEDMKSKINDVFDFVSSMKAQIKTMDQQWFTAKEAAAYIRVSKSTLVNALRDQIPPRKDRNRIVYSRQDLDNYWDSKKSKQ